MMCNFFPSKPKPPPPPPLPKRVAEVSRDTGAAQARVASDAKKRMQARSGYAQTIGTGPRGLLAGTDDARTSKVTLGGV
jgi:hypothetical protein|tara:strand:- start:113 stop:349 length:237 start_codon:yes stop_codon:yes gene_type:complete